MATKTLTKEEWNNLIERFKYYSPYNKVDFMIDGCKVTLVHLITKNRVALWVFINDKIPSIHLEKDVNVPKFCLKREKFLFPQKTRDDMKKVIGKRRWATEKKNWEQKITLYDNDLKSIKNA